jgi:hypothetical protein
LRCSRVPLSLSRAVLAAVPHDRPWPYTEHFPPDVNAAFLWLQNWQPNKWRDREEIEHGGTIEQRIMAMTPGERMADAIALVERVRARLAMPDAQIIEAAEGHEDT